MHLHWAVHKVPHKDPGPAENTPEHNLHYHYRTHQLHMLKGAHTVQWHITIPEYTNFCTLDPGTELVFMREKIIEDEDAKRNKKRAKVNNWIADEKAMQKKGKTTISV